MFILSFYVGAATKNCLCQKKKTVMGPGTMEAFCQEPVNVHVELTFMEPS